MNPLDALKQYFNMGYIVWLGFILLYYLDFITIDTFIMASIVVSLFMQLGLVIDYSVRRWLA